MHRYPVNFRKRMKGLPQVIAGYGMPVNSIYNTSFDFLHSFILHKYCFYCTLSL